MAESFCRVGGDIEICFETFGDPADPAMLLSWAWARRCSAGTRTSARELAARGFYVIRYDNRDIGRSTHLDSAPDADARPDRAPRQARRVLHARRHGRRRASACSTTSGSSARTSSAPRWAG